MVAALAADHQMVARAAARVVAVASAGGDEPTAGLPPLKTLPSRAVVHSV